MKKRLISILIAASMVCSMTATGAAAQELTEVQEEALAASEVTEAEAEEPEEIVELEEIDEPEEIREIEAEADTAGIPEAEEIPVELVTSYEETAEETIDTYDVEPYPSAYIDGYGNIQYGEVPGAAYYYFRFQHSVDFGHNNHGGYLLGSGTTNVYQDCRQYGYKTGTYNCIISAKNSVHSVLAQTEVTFTYTSNGKLDTPVVNRYGTLISWNPVANAEKYEVMITRVGSYKTVQLRYVKADENGVCELDLADWEQALIDRDQDFEIHVTAYSYGYEHSEECVITVTSTDTEFYAGQSVTWSFSPAQENWLFTEPVS